MFNFIEGLFHRLKNEPKFDAEIIAHITASAAFGLLGDNLHCTVWYGSTKYGKPRHDSDVDILVVAKQLPVVYKHQEMTTEITEKAISLGVPRGFLHLTTVDENEFSAYPSVHPAIFAAFMRGDWILPPIKRG